MVKRKKLVIIKINDGAKTRIVKTKTRLRLVTNCCGELGALKERLTVGIVSAAKLAHPNIKIKTTRITVFNGYPHKIMHHSSRFCVKKHLIFKQLFVKITFISSS